MLQVCKSLACKSDWLVAGFQVIVAGVLPSTSSCIFLCCLRAGKQLPYGAEGSLFSQCSVTPTELSLFATGSVLPKYSGGISDLLCTSLYKNTGIFTAKMSCHCCIIFPGTSPDNVFRGGNNIFWQYTSNEESFGLDLGLRSLQLECYQLYYSILTAIIAMKQLKYPHDERLGWLWDDL